jgi:mannosyltransferase OCH1-like enzyme
MKKDINKIKSVIIFLIICVLAIISLSIFEEIKRAKLLYPVSYKESIADDSICNNCEMKIPKIIHRIWTVWDPHKREMSDTYKKFDKILKDLHPDWQIMEWDDEKIEKFIKLNYPDFIEVYLGVFLSNIV